MRLLRGPAVGTRGAAAVAAVAALLLLAGCGGGQPATPEPFGVALQVADCHDWRESSPQQRQSAIDQLENAVRGPNQDGNTLSDDAAYSTLDARCKPDFARGFLLYQLYIRAAAFTPSDG